LHLEIKFAIKNFWLHLNSFYAPSDFFVGRLPLAAVAGGR